MTRNANYPPNLTRSSSETYVSKVLKKDPNWLRDSQEDVEFEYTKPRGGDRLFKGFYKSRGPYAG